MSGIDDAGLVELAALAAAATPGPWRAAEGELEGKPASEYVRTLLANREADGTSSGRLFLALAPNDIDPELGAEVVPATTGDGPRAEANAAFIAAANPQTIAALVAEVQRLRTVEAAVRSLAAEWDVRHAEGDAMLGCPAGAGYYDLLGDELTHAMTAAALAAARTGEASDG